METKDLRGERERHYTVHYYYYYLNVDYAKCVCAKGNIMKHCIFSSRLTYKNKFKKKESSHLQNNISLQISSMHVACVFFVFLLFCQWAVHVSFELKYTTTLIPFLQSTTVVCPKLRTVKKLLEGFGCYD